MASISRTSPNRSRRLSSLHNPVLEPCRGLSRHHISGHDWSACLSERIHRSIGQEGGLEETQLLYQLPKGLLYEYCKNITFCANYILEP